jgi:hypothetical protein
VLIVREFRRRDHRAMSRQLDDLTREVNVLRADLVALAAWAFVAHREAARVGVTLPAEPEPRRVGP